VKYFVKKSVFNKKDIDYFDPLSDEISFKLLACHAIEKTNKKQKIFLSDCSLCVNKSEAEGECKGQK
jgi:hypothetical protein